MPGETLGIRVGKGSIAGHSSTNRDGDGNSADGSSGGSSEITRLSKSLVRATGGAGGKRGTNGQPGKLLFSEDTTGVRAKKLKGQFWTGGGGNGVHHGIGAAGSYYPFINILDGGLAKASGGGSRGIHKRGTMAPRKGWYGNDNLLKTSATKLFFSSIEI